MAISFNTIPSTLRVPFTAVEFDSSRSQQGPALLPYRGLLIGQKVAAGTATADTVVRCTSANNALTLSGRGSMLHRGALAWFASNSSTELWLGVLADNGAGVAASGTIVVSGTATASGTIALYCGGDLVTVGVAKDDTANTIAASINAAINLALDLPITSTVSTATVTALFRHKGLVGNSYDIRVNANDGEVLPAGVSLAITQLASGTTNPVLTTLFAAMADIWFQILPHPYTDATSLTAIEAEMATRAGPMRSQDGLAITGTSGTFSAITTLGLGRNSQFSVIVAPPGATPMTPPFELAAEVGALVALAGAADPARPFQTLALTRAKPIALTDQWSLDERNLMLFDGIATTKRGPSGGVQIERLITTYQKAPSGATDTAYLDATTVLTLLYLRFSFRSRIQTRYPRHKLASDGTQFGSGQAVITPKIGKAEAVMWFREMEELGLVEGFDQFKRDLVVERNVSDPNRLDFLLPPDLINQLIVTAAQTQFRL